MIINTEIIRNLRPCEERFDNYLKHYSDFNGDLKQFIELENITYNDKVWIVTRLFTKEQNVKWAVLCAESVLHFFESAYPDDNRPRLAIEAAARTATATAAAYAAAGAAADAAVDAAADANTAAYTAYAAADANTAAYTAYAAAANAAYAAAYAYAANAAYAAANAAADAAYAYAANAASNKELQEQKNLQFMLEVL